jgi:precorrin-4/cobalt-precorrin-4 C11-methyltransferase
MRVYFVGSGPGDPELLTVKAQRLLRECRFCIYAGSLINPDVLDLLDPDAEKHDSAGMDLRQITALFLKAREKNVDVVRLHSGDPSIYGAIREQMRELDRMGIDYEVVPGVSAFQAAAAALRVELTAPEVAQTIILTRLSGRTLVPRGQELEDLAPARATMCLFLSAPRMEEVVRKLSPSYGPDCPVAVVYRVSRADELILRGTLRDIALKAQTSSGLQRTAMILVGHALSPDAPPSRLYDSAFAHGYRRKGRP